MTSPLIVLTTDFGTADTYVGVMKGVIAGIAPRAAISDLVHEIRPQDVRHGAYSLLISVPYFPAETIFVTVVDPGVGSARRPVAVRAGDWFFVAPDNGLLSYLLERYPATAAVELAAADYRLPQISTTFHGRDIFAPAGAHLAAGVPLAALGPALDPATLVRLPALAPRRDGEGWEGQVLHIDHFGNIITTLDRATLGLAAAEPAAARASWKIAVGATTVRGLSTTFADVAPGEPVAYIGSDDFLEVALRNGDGARALGVAVGDPVRAWRAWQDDGIV